MEQFKRGNGIPKLKKRIRQIKKKYNRENNGIEEPLAAHNTFQIQQIAGKKEIQNYDEANNRKNQNQQFENNPEQFYRERGKQTKCDNPPKKFWKGIFEDEKEHNMEEDWI